VRRLLWPLPRHPSLRSPSLSRVSALSGDFQESAEEIGWPTPLSRSKRCA